MGGGLALILAYVRARKRYSAYQREEDERMQREQDLYDARKELELQKVNAELERVKAAAEQVRVCPHCGGSTKGEICEYCGSRL
jgi:rRNA maturation endonuclease Nob1